MIYRKGRRSTRIKDLTSVVALIKVEYSAGDFFLFLMMVLMTAMLPDTTL